MQTTRLSMLLVAGLLVASTAAALEPAATNRRDTTATQRGAAIQNLKWADLVPPDYRPDKLMRDYQRKVAKLKDDDPRAQALADDLRVQWESAPVVKALNNRTVKLEGFLVALEGDGATVSEFLLVPYFGACIHVPPPPSNQIVLVRTGPRAFRIKRVYDTVIVTGRLKTEHARNELASASYVIDASQIEQASR